MAQIPQQLPFPLLDPGGGNVSDWSAPVTAQTFAVATATGAVSISATATAGASDPGGRTLSDWSSTATAKTWGSIAQGASFGIGWISLTGAGAGEASTPSLSTGSFLITGSANLTPGATQSLSVLVGGNRKQVTTISVIVGGQKKPVTSMSVVIGGQRFFIVL